jgi:hypothetical protein
MGRSSRSGDRAAREYSIRRQPRQYTADIDRSTGWAKAMSAMVRSTATVVKGSAEGVLKTFTAFTSVAPTIDVLAALGEFPASMWTSRGRKARTRLRRPFGSVCSTQPSRTSLPPKVRSIRHSSASRVRNCPGGGRGSR